MTPDELRSAVAAITLTAGGPARAAAIAEALDQDEVDEAAVEEVLKELAASWDHAASGVRLERVAGGWRAVTPPELDPYLRAYHGVASRQRLSQAALEVLAIIAHRQPVTLPEISFLRGIGSAGVVRTLLDRGLVRLAGRKQVVGKPFLYRTSKEFLVHFGLERAEDLPDPEELVGEEMGQVAD